MGLASTANAAYVDDVLALGPVAYWRLGELTGTTAAEEIASANGTYNGGVTLGRDGIPAGGGNTSVHFDQVDDYVELPDTDYFSPTGEFTVMEWFKADTIEAIDGTGGGGFNYIFSHNGFGSGGDSVMMYFRESDSSGSITIRVENAADRGIEVMGTNAGGFGSGTQGNFADGEWHLIAVTLDNTDGLKVLVDGVVEDHKPAYLGTAALDPAGAINLGRRVDNSRYYGGTDLDSGLIDEVAVFDYALSESQVLAIYNVGVPEPTTVALSLVALGTIALGRTRGRRELSVVGV